MQPVPSSVYIIILLDSFSELVFYYFYLTQISAVIKIIEKTNIIRTELQRLDFKFSNLSRDFFSLKQDIGNFRLSVLSNFVSVYDDGG